jgi:hypothetical protein
MSSPAAPLVALMRARSDRGAKFPTNTCLMQVRGLYGIDAKYPTAYQAWLGAGGAAGENTHTVNYHVQGMPVFLKGAGAAGHICLYDSDGYVWTTDYPRKGHWNRVKLGELAKAWNMRVLGGSEVLNGVRVLPHREF